MILNFIVLVLASKITTIQSDCSDFENQWKTCLPDMLPSNEMNNAFCIYKNNTSEKVIIVNNNKKASAITCHNDIFPENVFQCLPFGNTKVLLLTDCPFPQTAFDKFFYNSNLNELTVLYQNSHILHTSLRLRNLPFLQFFSLKNVHTFSYFELLLNSVPHMKSIKISNSTFTMLPERPFQELSLLKGLVLTNGILEVLPDDFLIGPSLRLLDFSFNRLKNFQPILLKNMKELKRLSLSHNLLETIDENLLNDTISLEALILNHNKIRSLPVDLFKTSINIRGIDISHNKLSEIPDNIFQGLKELYILRLSHNNLRLLPPNAFNNLKALAVLELQYNQLLSLTDLFTSENSLYKIDLSGNKISRIASSAPFGKSRYLVKVNISYNHLKEFIHLNWTLYNIKELDLSGNLIRELTLPTPAEPGELILLQNNNISRVTVTKNLTAGHMYALSGNPFDCNCDLGDFISHLPTAVDANKLVCQDPWYRANKRLIDFLNDTEICEENNDCPLDCKCRLLPSKHIEVYCNNTGIKCANISLPFQTTILHLENNKISSLLDIDDEIWENITHLYLSNNSLTSLQNWSVPSGLRLLAVDGNNLTNLSSSVMDAISESEDFSVYLKGNKWPCDCQIIPLKKWMMKNLSKVNDSRYTYCKSCKPNSNKFDSPIAQIPLDEFVCTDEQHSSQLSNCVKSEISVSAIFCILLSFANKIY